MQDIIETVKKYQDDIFRIALSFLRSPDLANDVVQEVFYKYFLCKKEFENERHLKNWLIKVAVNQCKKELGSPFRKRTVLIEDYINALEFEVPEQSQLVLAVMKLKPKYRTAVHLYYFEGYSVKEISQLLAVKSKYNSISASASAC